MKALEILERIPNECEASENFMGYTYEAEKVDKIIDEAIAELKALQAGIEELEAEQKKCGDCAYVIICQWSSGADDKKCGKFEPIQGVEQ